MKNDLNNFWLKLGVVNLVPDPDPPDPPPPPPDPPGGPTDPPEGGGS